MGRTDLLVVPGLDWSAQDLQRLRDWQSLGYRLAGHGWRHKADAPQSLTHRIHSALLSRDVAEHLSLSSEARSDLMQACFDWFGEHGLGAPSLYVPPAWALGDLASFQRLPVPGFRFVETLLGYYDREGQLWCRLPLVGFEADTGFRAVSLGVSNALMRLLGSDSRPVRISLHPKDRSLLLGGRLDRLLSSLASNASLTSVDAVFTELRTHSRSAHRRA